MIDIIYSFWKIFVDTFLLVYNIRIPWSGHSTIKFGDFLIGVIIMGTMLGFIGKFIGFNRQKEE